MKEEPEITQKPPEKRTMHKVRERPNWDDYFLMMAFIVSTRSDDPDRQHGSVIVTSNNHILGSGYNGTIKKSNSSKIPYDVRDKKRLYMIHSEENAILNSWSNPHNLKDDVRIYVTGLPCVNCLQRIINFGIKEVCCPNVLGSITENEETKKMREDLIEMSGIKMTYLDITSKWVQQVVNINDLSKL